MKTCLGGVGCIFFFVASPLWLMFFGVCSINIWLTGSWCQLHTALIFLALGMLMLFVLWTFAMSAVDG